MQPDAPSQHAIDPRNYLRPVWARKWWILAIVVAATAAAYAYSAHQAKQYRATAQIFVKSSALDQILVGEISSVDDERNTANQAELLRSRSGAEGVAKRSGFQGDPAAPIADTKTTPGDKTDFVTIVATQPS